MYEMHDDTDGFLNDGPTRGEFEFPAPLESWSLNDFADLVTLNGAAS